MISKLTSERTALAAGAGVAALFGLHAAAHDNVGYMVLFGALAGLAAAISRDLHLDA